MCKKILTYESRIVKLSSLVNTYQGVAISSALLRPVFGHQNCWFGPAAGLKLRSTQWNSHQLSGVGREQGRQMPAIGLLGEMLGFKT
jgi:hypothetical protein